MNWIELNDLNQLDTIGTASAEGPIVIFKHSTRCSISSTAKSRLERNWDKHDLAHVQAYHLDLIAHRDVSNEIAERFSVHHESPQLLLVHNGEVPYAESHLSITASELEEQVKGVLS